MVVETAHGALPTVAVTGSTGFIGRHVVAELTRRGCTPVRVLRAGSSTETGTGSGSGMLPSVSVDLAEPSADVFEAIGAPDVLIHLAWGGLPNYGAAHHYERELPLHHRWLKRLVQGGLRHMVVTGTCFEYGLQSGALDEEMAAQPANAYAHAKDALRRQLGFLQGDHPYQLTWARLFYMHGAGQSEQSLLPQLERALQRGDARFPMSGGEQLRDYLPVTEVAANLVDLALTGLGHGVVNVCSGRPLSVRRLVETWLAERGAQIALDLGRYPYPAHEAMAFWGDRRKLARCLELVPPPLRRPSHVEHRE